jgi:hypothetical protein
MYQKQEQSPDKKIHLSPERYTKYDRDPVEMAILHKGVSH